METIIRLMANNRTYDEQTSMVEQVYELMEFTGVAVASIVVLLATTVL